MPPKSSSSGSGKYVPPSQRIGSAQSESEIMPSRSPSPLPDSIERKLSDKGFEKGQSGAYSNYYYLKSTSFKEELPHLHIGVSDNKIQFLSVRFGNACSICFNVKNEATSLWRSKDAPNPVAINSRPYHPKTLELMRFVEQNHENRKLYSMYEWVVSEFLLKSK